jgi:hypothetical protein
MFVAFYPMTAGSRCAWSDVRTDPARALVRMTKPRGRPLQGTDFAPYVVAAVHPAAVLRERGDAARRDARAGLVRDLEVVLRLLEVRASRRARSA